MDAKPQRPRVLRVRDENLPSAVEIGPAKTLHQRNKSTPALSTLLNPIGGTKGGLRRTAFADVSNTAGSRGLSNTAKDDLNLPKKITLDPQPLKPTVDVLKENGPLLGAFKPNALLRPAQRPLSTAAAKAALAGTSAAPSLTSLLPTAPAKPSEAPGLRDDARPLKTLAKKQTTIFKDAVAPPVEVVPESSVVPDTLETSSATSSATLPNSSAAPLPALTAADSLIDPILEGVALPGEELLPAIPENEVVAAATALDSFQLPAILSTTDIGLDQIIEVPLTSTEIMPHAVVDQPPAKLDLPASLETLLELSQTTTELEKVGELDVKSTVLPGLHAEPEGYWEPEEEDEYFDADGYTTARSIRSRGDTTGGLTVLMEPRMTARVEKELAAAKQYVDAMRTPEDVEDEAWDTSMVAEYGDEIFDYMRNLEQRMKPNPHYMDSQTEIQWSMRAVLMDWLVQVHHRFTLLPETLFLAINYIDRFLSCKVVSLGKLQLVGATAIFVAAKYEEINCPSVQEIIYMVDGGYTMDEILKAERFMLTMLHFELGWPGPMSFLRRISKADDYDLETRTLAKYFLEVTVMDERFVGCAPSFTAAGAHCLARLMLRKGDWSLAHVHYSQYPYYQLRPLVQTLLDCCEDPRRHHAAVFDKYSDKRYKRASLYVETELQKGFQLPAATRESSGYTPSFRRK